MTQSFVKNLIHLIFSTGRRRPDLTEAIRPDLFAYQAGVFKQCDSRALVVGGVDDHVHALFSLSKNRAMSEVVGKVKASSSRWMTKTSNSRFSWQGGYAAFSVSESNLEYVKKYIENQNEHHKTMSFQEEVRALFELHRIAYDERYVWD